MTLMLFVSFLFILAMGFYLLTIRDKTQQHKMFVLNVLCMLFWGCGYVLRIVFQNILVHTNMFFLYITSLGITFFPVTLWFTGLIFKKSGNKISVKYLLALVIPIISNIMLWTNYHNWYYKGACPTAINTSNGGPYFLFVHLPYFYLFLILWIINMGIYAVKNGGLLFKQVILTIIGTSAILTANLLLLVKVLHSPYWNIVAFAFMSLCYLIAIVKYNFLDIIPIAKEKIIDNITDSIVVLDDDFKVQYMNTSFTDTFNDILPIKLAENFIEVLERNKFINISSEYLREAQQNSIDKKHVSPLEIQVKKDKLNKWFNVLVSSIDKDRVVGCIITFRDITQEKQNEISSMERKKLRGFVQIAGDLAHEINSPLLVINASITSIDVAIKKYKDNPELFIKEYDWLEQRLKAILKACDNSGKAANKLRWQTSYIYDEKRTEFLLHDIIFQAIKWPPGIIDLLKTLKCKYSLNMDNPELKMIGYPENLSKVLTNIIKNAIESYKETNVTDRTVEITTKQTEDIVTIAIKDFGIGIPEELQQEILKKPLKTRNLKADGGGISLFLAPLIVTGQLEGNIWFESKEGEGSTFYISIPIICNERKQEDS